MREATQATVSRLPGRISGPRWSSWTSALTGRRRQPSPRQVERMERLYRQHLQRTRPVQVGSRPGRQWVRQV